MAKRFINDVPDWVIFLALVAYAVIMIWVAVFMSFR